MTAVSKTKEEFARIFEKVQSDERVLRACKIAAEDAYTVFTPRQWDMEVLDGRLRVQMYQTLSRASGDGYFFEDYFEVKISKGAPAMEELREILDAIVNCVAETKVHGRPVTAVGYLGDDFAPAEIDQVGARFLMMNFIGR